MAKKRRLGRGLEALLNASQPAEDKSDEAVEEPKILKMPVKESAPKSAPAKEPKSATKPKVTPISKRVKENQDDGWEQASVDSTAAESTSDTMKLSVYDIDDNPFQPRREFSQPEIASLSESLKEHDMLQPILVRKAGERFQLISGERRLRAAIQAGWKTIPARIRQADDRLVAELAIVENLQRKDLNAIEKALSFRRYIDEHNCSQDVLATRLKIDRSTIANLMRLLELPNVIQDALQANIISAGHARALLPLGEEATQVTFCNRIQKQSWSVRETERQVRLHIDAEDGVVVAKKTRTKDKQLESLEGELRRAMGTKVEIKQSSKGRGQIILHFTSAAEFDRIRASMTDDYAKSRAS